MSKSTLYARFRFCPYCGLEKLQRDFYQQELRGKNHQIQYHCPVCGIAFQVRASTRSAVADDLQKLTRSVRIGNFHDNVTEEVRREYERLHPEPLRYKLWRLWRRLQLIPVDPMTHAKERTRKVKAIARYLTPEFFKTLDLVIAVRKAPRDVHHWRERLITELSKINRDKLTD
jgi:transcription elongation factor Elf1